MQQTVSQAIEGWWIGKGDAAFADVRPTMRMESKMSSTDAIDKRPVVDLTVIPVERKPLLTVGVVDQIHEKVTHMREQPT